LWHGEQQKEQAGQTEKQPLKVAAVVQDVGNPNFPVRGIAIWYQGPPAATSVIRTMREPLLVAISGLICGNYTTHFNHVNVIIGVHP
jgi:hypothetical protein